MAKLVFLADGTYSGTNLPNGVFHPDPTDPLHGPPDWASEDAISGSWKTGWDARVKIAYITVSIEGRSSSTPIEVEEGPKRATPCAGISAIPTVTERSGLQRTAVFTIQLERIHPDDALPVRRHTGIMRPVRDPLPNTEVASGRGFARGRLAIN